MFISIIFAQLQTISLDFYKYKSESVCLKTLQHPFAVNQSFMYLMKFSLFSDGVVDIRQGCRSLLNHLNLVVSLFLLIKKDNKNFVKNKKKSILGDQDYLSISFFRI
jgi:hypothetical protein